MFFPQVRILIDAGSSTAKIYKFDANSKSHKLKLLNSKSFHFKKDFDPQKGIDKKKLQDFIEYLTSVRIKHPKLPISIYATAFFRKLERSAQFHLKDKIYEKTGLFFNIIEHDLENFYLQVALAGKYPATEPILLINIGGGSTELVVLKDKEVLEHHNLNLGVGTIISEHPEINEQISEIRLADLVKEIQKQLPELKTKPQHAFYSGGELNYMNLANYPLIPNTIFDDPDHPSIIATNSFIRKNTEVFDNVELADLEKLMPENPAWMHGARPCSAISQAIVTLYGVEMIIPSDSNLIHGVVRQEFRRVTISGSFRKHIDQIFAIKKELEAPGTEVLSPRFSKPQKAQQNKEFVVFKGKEGLTPIALERYHLDCIERSDALIVCDPLGYVGASAMFEIGYANALGKKVIFVEKPEEFLLGIVPGEETEVKE